MLGVKHLSVHNSRGAPDQKLRWKNLLTRKRLRLLHTQAYGAHSVSCADSVHVWDLIVMCTDCLHFLWQITSFPIIQMDGNNHEGRAALFLLHQGSDGTPAHEVATGPCDWLWQLSGLPAWIYIPSSLNVNSVFHWAVHCPINLPLHRHVRWTSALNPHWVRGDLWWVKYTQIWEGPLDKSDKSVSIRILGNKGFCHKKCRQSVPLTMKSRPCVDGEFRVHKCLWTFARAFRQRFTFQQDNKTIHTVRAALE